VGDLFMSLIHTCQLCNVNSFNYLTELLWHHRELPAKAALRMPWNYHVQLPPAGV
jgi:transposase